MVYAKFCLHDIDSVGQFKAKLNIGKINDKNSAGGCFKNIFKIYLFIHHNK